VAAGGRLYAVGGFAGGTYSAVNEEFDPVTGLWAPRTGMTFARDYLAAASVDGKVYAVGGQSATGYQHVEEYDPVSNTWTTKANLPTGRDLLTLSAVGGKLYAIGGYNGSAVQTANEEYDPATDAWASRAAVSPARMAAAAAAVGGKVYVIGGQDPSDTNTVQAYDPALDAWAARRSLPGTRANLAAAAVGPVIYAVDGSSGPTAYSAVVEAYDTLSDSWSEHGMMADARRFLAAAELDGRVEAVGGYDGAAETGVTEEFDPGTARVYAGLAPNALYTFKARARNLGASETEDSPWVSTYTYASVPSSTTPVFLGVWQSSVSFQWSPNGNPGATDFESSASTAPDFNPGAAVFTSPWLTGNNHTFSSTLSPQTTYYFRVRARNAAGIPTDYAALGATCTLANVPVSAVSTFTAVGLSSMTVSWDSAGNPVDVTTYTVVLTTGASFPNSYSGNSLASGAFTGAQPSAPLYGLQANTTYNLFVGAVNFDGVATPFAPLGSTVTLTFSPGAASPTFLVAQSTALTLQWNPNGNLVGLTTYYVVLSTGGAYPNLDSGNVALSTVPPGPLPAATLSGLAANTTYYAYAAGLNYAGAPSSFTLLGSTPTLAAPPGSAVSTFTAVSTWSLTVAWGTGGNAVGLTSYTVTLTTETSFPFYSGDPSNVTLPSTAPVGALPMATLYGLGPNTIYRLYVAAINYAGAPSQYTALGATATAVQAPTGVNFDEISSTTLVASAYAPTPAFANISVGTSGTNVAFSPAPGTGSYDSLRWHGEGWAAKSVMPHGVYNAAAATSGGRIYALGGSDTGYENYNQVYDPVSDTWLAGGGAAMPASADQLSAASYGGKVYWTSGYPASWSSGASYSFDPANGQWSAKANLQVNEWSGPLTELDGKLYVTGGATGFSAPLCGGAYTASNVVQAYDPVSNSWALKHSLGTATFDGAAAAVNGRLYFMEGCGRGTTNEYYDPLSDSWTAAASVS
ncbi:MAG: hypothetical protein KGL53_07560, partial [Elusimicrobia bacterium]|nr:hypothetical protein [Elusimicrobiota bacterium]